MVPSPPKKPPTPGKNADRPPSKTFVKITRPKIQSVMNDAHQTSLEYFRAEMGVLFLSD